jgi:hypothetical protein
MAFPRGRAITLAVFAACLTFAFQNCSKSAFGNKGTQESLKNSGGNYDGKIYVLIDPVKPCADGSHVVTQITERPAAYVLDREQCATVPGGRVLADSEVTRDPLQPSMIVYNSQTLVQSAPAGFKMKCLSKGSNPAGKINVEMGDLQNGATQAVFEVVLSNQQSSRFTEVVKSNSYPVTDVSELYAEDGSDSFDVSPRDRDGSARISWQSRSGAALKDDVLCETY